MSLGNGFQVVDVEARPKGDDGFILRAPIFRGDFVSSFGADLALTANRTGIASSVANGKGFLHGFS